MALPNDARIGCVTLTVSNLERSLRCYRDILGFDLLVRDGVRAVLSADGATPLVELVERTDAIARPRRCTGLYHIAILVPSRAALGRSLRRLSDARWPLTGVADHLVSEALYLDDPDGLGIEIYRDRPRESWRMVDGQIVMATDPLDLPGLSSEPGAELVWTGLEPDTALGHVHLHVACLQDAEAFYCDGLGFTPMLRRNPGALFVAAGGYHHHVGLNTWAGVGAPPPPLHAVGLRGFTVRGTGITPREVIDAATGIMVALVPDGQG